MQGSPATLRGVPGVRKSADSLRRTAPGSGKGEASPHRTEAGACSGSVQYTLCAHYRAQCAKQERVQRIQNLSTLLSGCSSHSYKTLPAQTVGKKRSLRNVCGAFPRTQCPFVVCLLPHTLCASTKSMNNTCKRKAKPRPHASPLLATVVAIHQTPTACQAT